MFESIKKLFTKVVQLTSDCFLKSEVIREEVIRKDEPASFVRGEVVAEKSEIKKTPKIKQFKKDFKYKNSPKYRK